VSTQSEGGSHTRLKLLLDLILFLVFLVALEPGFSGLAWHEWLGIAFAAAIAVHLLLSWQWIVAVIRRIFAHLPAKTRINAVLNLLLFVSFIVVSFSGILISREALPVLGFVLTPNFAWRMLHGLSADLSMVLIAAHLGLHWSWIVSTLRTYVWNPLTGAGRRPRPAFVAVGHSAEVQS